VEREAPLDQIIAPRKVQTTAKKKLLFKVSSFFQEVRE
jgi:hypothetical protein